MGLTFKTEAEGRAEYARLRRAFAGTTYRVTFHPPRIAGGICHVIVADMS